MNDKHSTKNLEFSPILGVEKSCPEKFSFDINGSYIYQIGSPEQEIVPNLPLNWKIWFVPVYIISFVVVAFLTIRMIRPCNDLEMKMTLIATSITSLIITIMTTVVDVGKYEQSRKILRNL